MWFTLKAPLYRSDWQFVIDKLGHFLLEFFPQIWTQDTLRHIPGPIVTIFEICQFLMAPAPFENLSENGCLQKIKDISIMVHRDPNIQFWPKVVR